MFSQALAWAHFGVKCLAKGDGLFTFCAARTLGSDLRVGAYHAAGRPNETYVAS